jgi:serine/threonine-protein kinase
MQMNPVMQGIDSNNPRVEPGVSNHDRPTSRQAYIKSPTDRQETRMICRECGSRVYQDGKFCPRCGASQPLAAKTVTRIEDPLIGTSIDNKYQIVSRIGSGSLGTVYRAMRMRIGDLVAIKVLRSDLVADQQSVERFRRNAQAASRLKHPGLVTIYDFGVSFQGLVYVVMELIEGQSLRRLMDQQGPFTSPAVLGIINQVCGALDAAHNQGIVHGDLKPEKIMVSDTASGRVVKVLDFGLTNLPETPAKSDDPSQDPNVISTPHYMSPELCMGEKLDGRSDIYSLGVIMYEMLCGKLPFNAPKITAVIVQQVTQPPPPLRTLNATIAPAVEKVVQHTLEKLREARPQTAMALAQELSSAVRPLVSAPQSQASQHAFKTNPVQPPNTRATDSEAMAASLQLPQNVVFIKRDEQTSQANRRPLLYLVAFILLLAMAGGALALLMKGGNNTNVAEVAADQATADGTQKEGAGHVHADPPTPPVAPQGMVFVPGGEFAMGIDTGSLSERPAHTVAVSPFFIDKHEVTNEEYGKFVRATNRPAPAGWVNGVYPAGAARKPVTGVSWDDANAYALWAGKRLPTEEEWEFAARGKDGRRFPWGNQWGSGVANADVTARGHHHVSNVGAHPKGPSPFGALDMVGNAWEWTASNLVAYPGGQLSAPTHDDHKVIRGGSYKDTREQANATFRKCYPMKGGDYSDIGFRCVQDLPKAQ